MDRCSVKKQRYSRKISTACSSSSTAGQLEESYTLSYSACMNLSVYVPKDLEDKLRKEASARKLAPGLYVQQIVRQALEEKTQFSKAFEALAGSWDDERSAEAIIADIKKQRAPSGKRATLR
jgi:hypothetical protein